MSGLTNLVKSRDKEKYLYSGYRIAFEWNFGNDYARNITIFGVDTSLSSHADNLENNFLVPGEGDTFGINGSFGAPEKKKNNNFSKANAKFCLSLHYNVDNMYLFVKGKELLKFKADNENVNFPTQLPGKCF